MGMVKDKELVKEITELVLKKTGIKAKQLFGKQIFNSDTKKIEFKITHAINSKNELVALKENLSRN